MPLFPQLIQDALWPDIVSSVNLVLLCSLGKIPNCIRWCFIFIVFEDEKTTK